MKFISIGKRAKKIAIICILGFSILFSYLMISADDYLLFRRIKYKLIDDHGLTVNVDDNLDINQVSIKWISYKGEKFIFKNGKRTNKIGYHGGEYAFLVYYKDSLIKEAGHYVNKWDNSNDYHVSVFVDKKITATVNVTGADSISQHYWHEIMHPETFDSLSIHNCKLSTNSPRDTFHRNTIDLKLGNKDYERIEANEKTKFSLKEATISFNNNPLKLKKIKLAGATTLQYRRKSYKVSLNEPYFFKHKDTTLQIQNFRLLGLSMDPYYYNMFVSYSFMKELDLFNLYYTYVELKINNETQGLYLLIEEPEHYALKRIESDFIIRRNYSFSSFLAGITTNEFEYKSKITNDSLADAEHIESFKKIYKIVNKYHGKELYEELNKHIDMNQYTRWMAINYFLCNGDYTDEVYFYTQSTAEMAKFRIIPWDYDDILRRPPHEGWDDRHSKIGHKLIYSIEDSLDLKIANDPYLYAQYLTTLDHIMKTFDEEFIKRVFEDACYNIGQYIKDKNILSMSRYDKTAIKDKDDFITNLKATYLFLIERRRTISDNLQKINNLTDIRDSTYLNYDRLTLQNN